MKRILRFKLKEPKHQYLPQFGKDEISMWIWTGLISWTLIWSKAQNDTKQKLLLTIDYVVYNVLHMRILIYSFYITYYIHVLRVLHGVYIPDLPVSISA
jgi:hypothetical protein